MTPLTVEYLALTGAMAGALGGLVAAMNAIYGGFKKLPDKPLSVSKAAIRNRATFLTFRILVGGILGGAVTFWFGPDVVARTMSQDKLLFVQFAVGLAGSLLTIRRD
ncbi:MAG: hypothetical protein EON93_01415 [Burkholderiales bacterium]|nr:MAG: hypothetical protein EON93_01415 [Burkholderiales bacterium]